MVEKLPPDSEDKNSSVPDFYRPTRELLLGTSIYSKLRRFGREARPQQRIGWTAIPFAGLFGFLLWGFNEFTSLRGWVHVLTSRLILVAMFGAGCLMALMFAWVIPTKKKRSVVFVAVIVWGILLISLDRIAPKPSLSATVSQPATAQSTRTPDPAKSPNTIPSTTSRVYHSSTATPSPSPLVTEVARIGMIRADVSTNEKEYKIDVPIVLTNFSNQATEGKLEPSALLEDITTHEKGEPPTTGGIEMLSFGPHQELTYTFHLGGDEQVYKRIVNGDVIAMLTLRLIYQRNMNDDKTIAYKLIVKPDLKTRQVGIIYSGWDDK